MIYDLRQTTVYAYASPVAYAHHVLRLTPINRTRQRVHAAALEVEPVPAERREGHDFFGNHLTWIRLDRPHEQLVVKLIARVTVEQFTAADVGPTPGRICIRRKPATRSRGFWTNRNSASMSLTWALSRNFRPPNFTNGMLRRVSSTSSGPL